MFVDVLLNVAEPVKVKALAGGAATVTADGK